MPANTTRDISNSIRFGTTFIKIPQNVQVVGSQIMADQQIVSMSDGIARNVSGVTKLEHWGDSYTRINMRGSRCSRFPRRHERNFFVGTVDRGHELCGTCGVHWGRAGFMMSNGEPSGIYNVVTKKPTGQTKRRSYFYFTVATTSTGQRLTSMANWIKQDVCFTASMRWDKPPTLTGLMSLLKDTALRRLSATSSTRKQSSRQNITSNTCGRQTSALIMLSRPTATLRSHKITLSWNPGLEPTTVNDHTLILNLQHQFNKDWKLTAQTAYFNYNRQGSSMWPGSLSANGDMIRNVSIGDAINEMKFGQLYLNGKAQTGQVSHTVLAGLMRATNTPGTIEQIICPRQHWYLQHLQHQIQRWKPYYGYPSFDRSKSLKRKANNTQITQSYVGLYLQDVLGFFNDRLLLTLAGRYTYVKTVLMEPPKPKRDISLPRVGLNFSIDENTSVYALYDQTFSPKMGMLRSGKGGSPITGNNWEAGFNWFNNRWSTRSYRLPDFER